MPPLKEGNSSFGSSFSIFSWSSSSLSASVIIFEEFTTTFGLVHGFFREIHRLRRKTPASSSQFRFRSSRIRLCRSDTHLLKCIFLSGIFITVFVACRSNKIAYFLPYRPLSGTRHQLHLYIFIPLTSGVAITFPGFPKLFRGFFWQPPSLMCLVKHEN